jgi:hypothetical protein
MEAVDSVAQRYFAAMRERDLASLLGLFAADASIVLPDAREIAGLDAIQQWFTGLFGTQAPSPRAVALIAGERGVATEIETQLSNGSIRRTANFFHLNEAGRIQRLSVYTRSA